MNRSIPFRTVRDIHAAFESKKLSPVELTQEYLNAAKKSQTGAYLTLCDDLALQQARAAEGLIQKRGSVPRDEFPLCGIPLGIKDNLTMDGVKTTCASKMLENYVAPYTATCVSRLEKAGAVTLGKLNLDEFAMGGSNENSAFGPVKHPTHPDRVPGGSSGGSAAAVKADLCFASLGSDTGGSIRLPASYCGVVGLKPTYGRVSRFGLVAFASSLDQVGPFAHTVEDAALLMDVMSGHDPLDSTSLPQERMNSVAATRTPPNWSQIRIGVPKEYFVGGLAPAVEESIQRSMRWFEKQGAQLVSISLPHTEYAVSV